MMKKKTQKVENFVLDDSREMEFGDGVRGFEFFFFETLTSNKVIFIFIL
jgi:hypothetical protein